MEYSILWKTPKEIVVHEANEFTFIHDRESKRLRMSYYSFERKKRWYYEINLDITLAYIHQTDDMKNLIPEAHGKFIEIQDSPWIEELQKSESEVLDFWKAKHYAIFIEGEGLFEFIARGYEIYEGDPLEGEDE